MPRKGRPTPSDKSATKAARAAARAERALKQDTFLKQYQAAGEVGTAAKAAGIHRDTHYHWLKTSRAYAAKFRDAQLIRVELLETELRRRAFVGWDEPVFYKGQICGHVRKFSDVALIFALKGEKPEKYRERVEHTGKDGADIVFTLNLGDRKASAGDAA